MGSSFFAAYPTATRLLFVVMIATTSCRYSLARNNNVQLLQFPMVASITDHNQQIKNRHLLRQEFHKTKESILFAATNKSTPQVGTLYQGYGTHYIELWVGSPPQRQTVIVDTGSSVTAFPCSTCGSNKKVPPLFKKTRHTQNLTDHPLLKPNTCGQDSHVDTSFQETKSLSFQKLSCKSCQKGKCTKDHRHRHGRKQYGCRIHASYAEGSSWNAFEAQDRVYIGRGASHIHLKQTTKKNHVDSLASFSSSKQQQNNPIKNMTTKAEENDFVLLDPSHSFILTFGCQTDLSGLFRQQLADGILGMDQTPYSFWSQMYHQKKISSKSFSLCFAAPVASLRLLQQSFDNHNNDTNSSSSTTTTINHRTPAGALTLGDTDHRLHKQPMLFTASFSTKPKKFFTVRIMEIRLEPTTSVRPVGKTIDASTATQGGESKILKLEHGMGVVDSGTTDTYFPKSMKKEFQRAFKSLTGKSWKRSQILWSPQQFQQLPMIWIQLQGTTSSNHRGRLQNVLIGIPPAHYLTQIKPMVYEPRLHFDGADIILGANTLMGRDVFFDVEHDRIGWADSDCRVSSTLRQRAAPLRTKGRHQNVATGEINTTATSMKKEFTDNLLSSRSNEDEGDELDSILSADEGGTRQIFFGIMLGTTMAMALFMVLIVVVLTKYNATPSPYNPIVHEGATTA